MSIVQPGTGGRLLNLERFQADIDVSSVRRLPVGNRTARAVAHDPDSKDVYERCIIHERNVGEARTKHRRHAVPTEHAKEWRTWP